MPEDVVFKTKPQIAIDQIRHAVERGVELRTVCADAGYGYDSAFRDALDELGLDYAVGIQPATRVVRTDSALEDAISVEKLMEGLDRRSYRHITWRSGTNSAIHSWFARARVRATTGEAKRDEPRAEQWLLIERPPGESPTTKYFLLPSSATL